MTQTALKITRDRLQAIEVRLAREAYEDDLRYWPYLKDWLLKYQHKAAKGHEPPAPATGPLAGAKLAIAVFISLLVLAIRTVQSRLRAAPALIFSATSRLHAGGSGPRDEFAACAEALEHRAVPALYYTAKDRLLAQPFVWRCHENLIVTALIALDRFTQRGKKTGFRPAAAIAAIVAHETAVPAVVVERALIQFDRKVRAYQRLLRWLRPRHIYVVSAYTKTDVVYAAKNLGILVSEIQHGMLAPFHPSYGYVSLGRGWDLALPDRLIVNSPFWLKTQGQAPYAAVVLNPLSQKAPPPAAAKERPYLLFSGQNLAHDKVADLVTQFLVNPACKGVDFLYACHPSEDPKRVAQRIGGGSDRRIRVEPFVSSEQTRALIAGAQKHVSVYSSCHVDALEIKGETYVMLVPEFSAQTDLFSGIEGVRQFTNLQDLLHGPTDA